MKGGLLIQSYRQVLNKFPQRSYSKPDINVLFLPQGAIYLQGYSYHTPASANRDLPLEHRCILEKYKYRVYSCTINSKYCGKMTMNNDSFPFKIGDFECIAISDGTYTYAPPIFPPPATFLFANAPKERCEKALCQHNLQPEQWKEWKSHYICMIVNTSKHLVLVDTGADGIDSNTGKLLQNLQTEGIT